MAAKRIAFQQEAAQRQVDNAERVMLATIDRLEKIADRIESRIGKIKDQGGDTAEAEGYLADARADLETARGLVAELTEVDLSGEKAQENFQRIRAAAANVREALRSAHRNLMLAVRSLSAEEAKLEETEEEDNDTEE